MWHFSINDVDIHSIGRVLAQATSHGGCDGCPPISAGHPGTCVKAIVGLGPEGSWLEFLVLRVLMIDSRDGLLAVCWKLDRLVLVLPFVTI